MEEGRRGRGFRLKIRQHIANVNVKGFQPQRRGAKDFSPLPPLLLFLYI
jgi:hypothetical protein